MKSYDAIIVGGGIIGGALAFELAQRKTSVLLLDRQEPGQEASWAAAGMLAPELSSAADASVVPLAKLSFASYPAFIEKIEAASDFQAYFRRDGALKAFFGPDAEAERDRIVEELRQIGLAAESIPIADARAMEPTLNEGVNAVASLPYECSVDSRALTFAVLAACARLGVEIRAGCSAMPIPKSKGRCEGVIGGGEKFASENVIIAAGCFSSLVDRVARFAPTVPVRGQIVALRPPRTGPTRVLRSERGYVVPRNDGRIIAGSTSEYAGFEKCVTAQGIQHILSAATQLAPSLATAAIVDSWSGLRPDTPDHLPVLGPTEIEGLWIATGHYRNGILLAPGTARVMTEWILDGKPSLALEKFSPLRFAAERRSAAH